MSTQAGAERVQRRDLSAERIVAAAAEILRTEGEAALTMRRVADACGVTPMAIYHHVGGKEALVDLVMDDVASEIVDMELVGETWRDCLVSFALSFRRVFIENPGAGAVFVQRPVVTPAMARVTERLFELLAAGGIKGPAAGEAADAVVLVMMGSIANDLTRTPRVRDELVKQLPREATPLMAANIESYSQRDPEQRFRTALSWLIDGMEEGARRPTDSESVSPPVAC